jgi:hypothetical protein
MRPNKSKIHRVTSRSRAGEQFTPAVDKLVRPVDCSSAVTIVHAAVLFPVFDESLKCSSHVWNSATRLLNLEGAGVPQEPKAPARTLGASEGPQERLTESCQRSHDTDALLCIQW